MYSKDNKATHNFKIVGKSTVATVHGEKTVECDPKSPDHLFFNTDGKISSKRQFIFTGKTFDLTVNFLTYKDKNEIRMDGSHTFYKNGSIHKTIIYEKDKPVIQNFFHPNGQMESTIPGIDFLNGEYKMWHSNGQLSFSGNYKDNLKNGEFEQFNESGTLLKKGNYQDGKLVDGQPIVQDIIFNDPEVPARYEQGEEAFNQYLTIKAMGINTTGIVFSNKRFYLDITFDKTGKMISIINETRTYLEADFIKLILKDCPNFAPATVENIPVESLYAAYVLLTNEGIKMMQVEKNHNNVDIMPQFPGGADALRNFISSNVRYPENARIKRIQGKEYAYLVVKAVRFFYYYFLAGP